MNNHQLNALSQKVDHLNSQLSQLVPHRQPSQGSDQMVEDWYSFVFRGTIPASSTTVITQTNDATGHFDLVFITGINDGDYLLRIREGEQGKFLTANGEFIDSRNLVGTAQRPYFVKGRRRFRANTTLIIEFTDISGNDNNVELALHGIKVSVV